METNVIVKISDTEALETNLDEREYKMLKLCLEYEKDPFGSPNHLLMVLAAKLWKLVCLHASKS
jgi:hypothetical protein